MLINVPPFPLIGRKNIGQAQGNTILDANGEYCAQLLIALETGTIKYFHFCVDTVTNAGDFKISLCAVDDTSQPSIPGAILGVGNSAYGTITISTTGWKRLQLTSNYTFTKGDQFFVKIEHTNFQTGDSIKFSNNAIAPSLEQVNYFLTYLGSVLSASVIVSLSIGLETVLGTFLNTICWPTTTNNFTLKTSDTPDEIGNLISLSYKHRICGASFIMDIDYACNIVLYGSSTKTYSLIANRRGNVNITIGDVYFADPYTAGANESYRLSMLPTENNAVAIRDMTFPTSYETLAKAAVLPVGCSISKTYRTDAGAWTDDATKIASIFPIIDQIEIPPYLHHINLMGA